MVPTRRLHETTLRAEGRPPLLRGRGRAPGAGLIAAPAGSGKTLVAAEFVKGGAEAGEQCLLCGFEESRGQLLRNAAGWGIDFEAMERAGTLRVECMYPHACGLEEHLGRIEALVDDFLPGRVVVDSLSALERIGTDRETARVEGFHDQAASPAGLGQACASPGLSVAGGRQM
ncbi:MAG: ATPase domain-containing protein [Phycisphaerae bacterium]